jgi:hypothetical protein
LIPNTVGSLVGFLALVAPGIVYELRRATRRSGHDDSVFREISRTALTSLVFTGLAVCALALVRVARPSWMPDLGAWLRDGSPYATSHYRLLLRAAIIEIGLATSLAVTADALLGRKSTRSLVEYNILYHALRAKRPPSTTPWLRVKLRDETEIYGYLSAYTQEPSLENQEIALRSPLKVRTKAGDEELHQWARIVIRGDQIAFLAVTYLDTNDHVVAPDDVTVM